MTVELIERLAMQLPSREVTMRSRAMPRQAEPVGHRWRLLFGLTLLCMTPQSLLAKDDQARGLPPRVERVLQWFPEDAETLIVAQSVTVPDPDPDGFTTWQDAGVRLAIGEGLDLSHGQYFRPLRGRKLECVVQGAKKVEPVSSFGSLRSENCAILVFESDLGDASKVWTEGLRKEAEEVKTLVNREVFVFPSPTVMEPWEKKTRWQGMYFVVLKPDTILCASSDRYLEAVLRRVDDVPKARALPDTFPEWKQVDFGAPVWMLRHLPEKVPAIRTVGVTASFTKSGFRVVYVPKVGSELDPARITGDWLPPSQLELGVLRDRLKIKRQSDGSVAVSCDGKFDDTSLFWLWLHIYWLQGQSQD